MTIRVVAAVVASLSTDWSDRAKKPAGVNRRAWSSYVVYFSDELMSVNLVFRLVPRPLTTAMMASEMPAAIRPYSMAVAPDSSAQNFERNRFM